jgi:hypothetical protein
MSQTQTQEQNQTKDQVDKRAIAAIIRAIYDTRSFVVWYRNIYEPLSYMINDDDEFYKIENKLYEDIVEGRIKNVYRFQGPCDDSECDIVVISPIELDENQLKMLSKLTELYRFKGYDGDESEREELTQTLHNLVKMWASGCLRMSSPAEAVYMLARRYGLEIEEEEHLDRWYAGKVLYHIEGLDTRVVKWVDYCNDCIHFSTGNNFIEKCVDWRFEDEDS